MRRGGGRGKGREVGRGGGEGRKVERGGGGGREGEVERGGGSRREVGRGGGGGRGRGEGRTHLVALPGHWRWWQVLTDGVLRTTGNFLRWNMKRKLRHNDNNNNNYYSNNAAFAWKRLPTGGDSDSTLTGSLDGLGSVQRRSAEAFVVAVCHTHTQR